MFRWFVVVGGWGCVVAACTAERAPEVSVDPCEGVTQADPEWCECEPNDLICDGECDPLAVDPFDFVRDGGDCRCRDYESRPLDAQPPACVEVLQPCQMTVFSEFAYDASSGDIRSFQEGGSEVPLSIQVAISNPEYLQSFDPRDLCFVRLVPDAPTLPLQTVSFDNPADAQETFLHRGFRLAKGSFRVEGLQLDVDDATFPSCFARELDPEFAGGTLEDLFRSQDWGVFVGELWSQIEDDVSTSTGPLPDRYVADQLLGSSLESSVDVVPWGYAVGRAVDPVTFEPLVEEGGDPQYLSTEEMTPGSELGTGVYEIASYYPVRASRWLRGSDAPSPYFGCD